MNSSRLLAFILTSVFVSPLLARTIAQASELTTSTYDYVIVGAGTAGLVLANRLTEDPRVSVLVLEAGISDAGAIVTEAPFLCPTAAPFTLYDWNYTLVPQVGMDNRSFPYPRGRLLGGSSSINFMFHQYGSSEDWDRLGSISGDSGWSWSNMRKYIQKHEKFTLPADGHNVSGQYVPSIHGYHGMTSVSILANPQNIDNRVLQTTTQLAEFPYSQDTSGGDHSLLGIGYIQSSAYNGTRSSSSTSYLANANGRPNLTVLINATVLKLVQTGTTRVGAKSFRSVEFASSPGTGSTTSRIVTATNEVILSSGSFGTAQILQLSGIGNKTELEALGIASTIDSPTVGENLSDHTLLPNVYNVSAGESFDGFLRDPAQQAAALDAWKTNRTGMFANNISNQFGFLRFPANASVFGTAPDPAAGPNSPHWEIIFGNSWFMPGVPEPPTGSYLGIVVVLLTPTSRGTVKLRSPDPFDAPLVDPRYLTTPGDVAAMRAAVRAVGRLVGAPAWADYVQPPQGALAPAAGNADVDEYVRAHTTSILHAVGTAAVGGVVGADLRVRGADGLRVVDASVFPFVPSTHTQGPVYLLAERAAALIKAGTQ